MVDGGSVGAVTSYTFTNVHGEPHDRGQLRHQHLHDHGVGRRRTARISPTGAVAVNCGGNQTFTITPATATTSPTCWSTACRWGGDELHVHQRDARNHTIAASFALNTYTITASAGANGSITPTAAVSVNCGADQTFTITPNACYHVADVLGRRRLGGRGDQLHVHERHGATTRSRPASRSTPTPSPPRPAPTAASRPTGTVTVNCGDDQTFTITPNAGYAVADVLVDGSLGRRRHLVHVHQRDRRPHDRGELRGRHAARHQRGQRPDQPDQQHQRHLHVLLERGWLHLRVSARRGRLRRLRLAAEL